MTKHKNALGTFADIHQIESVLEQLKSAGVNMNNVSVVVPQSNSADPQLGKLIEPTVKSEHEFAGDRPVEQIGQEAAKAGAVGTVVGGVVAALTTLAFPAFSGAVVLVGMATGAFWRYTNEADAIIIPWKESIAPASDYATIHDVLAQNNSLSSDHILTNNDRDLGTLLGLYFDENTGDIEKLLEVDGSI